MTKMALHGQKGLELIGRAFWSIGFLEISLLRLYILSGIDRESEMAVEKKEKKEGKEKREKQRGFSKRGGLWILAPFLFKFLGAKLSGELG